MITVPIFLSVLPIVLIFILIVFLKQSALISSWAAMLVCLLSVYLSPYFPSSITKLFSASKMSIIICLQVFMVVCSGMYLNEVLKRKRVYAGMTAWFLDIRMSNTDKALLVILGIAPLMESMTGFGISLLVAVPLLIAISGRDLGLKQALLSMHIMPWGTLALATIVGSQLSGIDVQALGLYSSLTSFLIFPFVAVTLCFVSRERNYTRYIFQALCYGLIFSILLVCYNYLGLVELAGILSAISASIIYLCLFANMNNISPPSWSFVRPYVILLVAIFVVKFFPWPENRWYIREGAATFYPLQSPGIAIFLTVLIITRFKVARNFLKLSLQKSAKMLLTLFGFTLTAQVMVISGMVQQLSHMLPTTKYAFALVSPIIGTLSGYITGSNTGANAMFVKLQSEMGSSLGNETLFSAVQNSASGHAVCASIAFILLILAVADSNDRTEESMLTNFGLKVILMNYVLIAFATSLLVAYTIS